VIPSLDLVDIDKHIFNLYGYLFAIDLRTSDSTYAVTETYLTTAINNLYSYLFEVDLTSTTITLVTGFTDTSSLTNKVNGLVLYLFEVDLATTPTFDPNSS
jgi:hypothetical protein